MSKASKEYDEAKDNAELYCGDTCNGDECSAASQFIKELLDEIRQKDELILKLKRKGY